MGFLHVSLCRAEGFWDGFFSQSVHSEKRGGGAGKSVYAEIDGGAEKSHYVKKGKKLVCSKKAGGGEISSR